MVSGPNMRVGDAEREAVASQLREHYADGRLTLDELNERLDQAFAARTWADLNTVTRDLPVARPLAVGTPSGSSGSSDSGSAGSSRQGFGAGLLAPVMALVWLFVALSASIFLFGHGDRPIAVVLILAALAFLRRLIGGRRRGRGRGRAGRRCGFF